MNLSDLSSGPLSAKGWLNVTCNSLTTNILDVNTFTANTIDTNTLNTVNLNTSGHPSSGTYTPTFTNVGRMTSVRPNTAMFIRLQNIVIVYGTFLANTQWPPDITTVDFSINPPPGASFISQSALSVSLLGMVTIGQPGFEALCLIGYAIENPNSLHIGAASVNSTGIYGNVFTDVLFSYSICFLSG